MSIQNHHIQRNDGRLNAPNALLEKAKNGMWTASIREGGEAPPFYLHSRYDPVIEAERFAEAQLRNMPDEKLDRIVVYGAGCGHHVKALLYLTSSKGVPIEVWETNVQSFLQMEQVGVFTEIWENSRLTFIVSDDLQVFSKRGSAWQGHRVHVIVHEPSLRVMPIALESLKRVLQDYQVKQNSAIAHSELLQNNFEQNTQKDWPSVSYFQTLPSVPILLISGGPSLTKSVSLLPTAANHCLLAAVGTAVAPLWRQGIRPDFVVMTDPQPGMLLQLEGWESEEIPLFFLSTLFSGVIEQYRGPKFILYQEGYTPAEREAFFRGESLVQTGGSVSTTLFSFARLLGLGPLCLIGQDLAYTDDQTHMEGTPLYQRWEQQAKGERVLSFERTGTVVAPRNLLLYKKWFEEQARNSSETFYNATEGGAYIEGFIHITLEEFLGKVSSTDVTGARKKFRGIVQSTFPQTPRSW